MFVMLAYRSEGAGRTWADDFVGSLREQRYALGRRNRNRDDDLRRTGAAHGVDGNVHSGTRRKTIVDEDDRLVRKVREGPYAAICTAAAACFFELAFEDHHELVARYAEIGEDLRLDRIGAIGGKGAHRVLRMKRYADFSNDQHVHRQAQSASDFIGHRNAASRKCQHDGFMRPAVAAKLLR